MHQTLLTRFSSWVPFCAALAVLLTAYLPTLQTIPNGSEHYFMIDVGETQIVLNVWGTLHATGYPLYVMTGSALVAGMRALGIDAATAPGLVSLLWGLLALALMYALAVRVTRRRWLAAMMIVMLGLTRTVWIHHVIAEIYTFGLLIMMTLLALALWTPAVRHRLYWLALIGGIGVAHHRAIAMMIPALCIAVYPDLRACGKRLPLALAACLGLGLIGFAQYAYLPLRENAGAAWVYGEPGTAAGLWDQFTGREAARFIGTPASLDALIANAAQINTVLVTDLTLPGLLVGLLGLALGLVNRERRAVALALLVNGGAAAVFHYLFYTDILSALILPVLVSMAFGWLLFAEAVNNWSAGALRQAQWMADIRQGFVPLGMLAGALGLSLTLFEQNRAFITEQTHDPTGIETIALARQTPPGSALMLAWGPRHFAVGFARDVLGELPEMELLDHKADFVAVAAHRPLITPAFTFYSLPAAWWEAQLGRPVYLHAAAPYLVEIATHPTLGAHGARLEARAPQIVCTPDTINLAVDWYAPQAPARDLSVFVHLLDAAGERLAQADQAAPVYGWRPLTSWQADEIVRDIYPVPRQPGASRIRYGLYAQGADGSFENTIEYEVAVTC
jgi:hypothetical protein